MKQLKLRFWYSDLKQLLLKACNYLNKVWVFLFIFGDHMLIKYASQVLSYILCGGVVLAVLAHQKSKSEMLSSQVKEGNVRNRLLQTDMRFQKISLQVAFKLTYAL